MLDQKPSPPLRAGVSLLGQTFGRYRITQKLGAGGMGVVYRALDTTLERAVALKFSPNNLTVTSGDRTNLRREARVASTLDHPNVGVVHGLEETAGNHLFIVMQFYEGETLGGGCPAAPFRYRKGSTLPLRLLAAFPPHTPPISSIAT
jgi:serine/threonine protein kinase